MDRATGATFGGADPAGPPGPLVLPVCPGLQSGPLVLVPISGRASGCGGRGADLRQGGMASWAGLIRSGRFGKLGRADPGDGSRGRFAIY